MMFTTYSYFGFLIVAFLLHWSLPISWRKVFLVVASYFFYCTWRWEFGFLLLGVSLFNWAYGRWVLARCTQSWALVLGIVANSLPLLYFKYTNFLATNLAGVVNLLGGDWHPVVPNILLPLGISFFTFQGIAYLVDIATGEKPLVQLVDFLLFKALWPQLIAGPIVRLGEIRERIEGARRLSYDDFSEGCRRLVLGLVKKVVLADSLAPTVERVFLSNSTPNTIECLTGVLGFGMQIYFDFSAYSDLAIGSARLFGFRLPENFNWPYLAPSPREFWNRWHMTLSSWIRDYLFTPLAFASRNKPMLQPIWLLGAMAVCGLWHGAAWTFVIWGVWHGFLLLLNQSILRQVFPKTTTGGAEAMWFRVIGILLTFVLVHLGWVFFRAPSVEQALGILHRLVVPSGGLRPTFLRENDVLWVGILFTALVASHAWQIFAGRPANRSSSQAWLRWVRPVAYAAMIVAAIVFDKEATAFVYFQF